MNIMKRKLLPNLASFQHDKERHTTPSVDFIYVLGASDGQVKIGTTNDLWQRVRKLKAMSPLKLEPLLFWRCHSGKSVEAALHALFRDYRVHGEWFRFGSIDSDYNRWKYRHLALSALLTCPCPPVPIHGSILHRIQLEHVPDDDPLHDVPGGGDWSGRECYPTDLFAAFYPDEHNSDSFLLLNWSEEIRVLYGFG